MEAKGASHLPPQFEANRLLKLAYVALCAGDPAQAWTASRDAALLISERQNPLLALMARHNELVALIQMQQCPQALEFLPRVKALAAAVQEPHRWLSVLWAEGRLAWLLGQPERAEELFAKVRRGFLELGSGLRAAVATVELAHVLFLTGKAVLVKPLAEEMVAVFADKELKSELTEALTLFLKAALTERLDAQLLPRLVTYLHRAEYAPRLRFRARVG